MPLAEVVLQAKQLVGNDGSAKEMLDRAPEPPNEETVNAALKELREVGALQNDRVTALGLHLATFPVDVRVGKVLVLGTLLGCCSRAITTAAAMSHKSPFLRSEHAEQVKAEFAKPVPGSSKGTIASGQYSDQLVIVAAFESYKQVLQKHGRNKAMSFCRSKSLDAQILDGIDDMRQQFATLLTDNQLVGRPSQVRIQRKLSVGFERARFARDFLLGWSIKNGKTKCVLFGVAGEGKANRCATASQC